MISLLFKGLIRSSIYVLYVYEFHKLSEKALNRHRYLLDIDGNSSSWHRFWLIGTFGCVPIRFEAKWVEYWHEKLEEGANYLYANRETLSDVVDSLRKQPEKAGVCSIVPHPV